MCHIGTELLATTPQATCAEQSSTRVYHPHQHHPPLTAALHQDTDTLTPTLQTILHALQTHYPCQSGAVHYYNNLYVCCSPPRPIADTAVIVANCYCDFCSMLFSLYSIVMIIVHYSFLLYSIVMVIVHSCYYCIQLLLQLRYHNHDVYLGMSPIKLLSLVLMH